MKIELVPEKKCNVIANNQIQTYISNYSKISKSALAKISNSLCNDKGIRTHHFFIPVCLSMYTTV